MIQELSKREKVFRVFTFIQAGLLLGYFGLMVLNILIEFLFHPAFEHNDDSVPIIFKIIGIVIILAIGIIGFELIRSAKNLYDNPSERIKHIKILCYVLIVIGLLAIINKYFDSDMSILQKDNSEVPRGLEFLGTLQNFIIYFTYYLKYIFIIIYFCFIPVVLLYIERKITRNHT